ncbi:S-adenosyl-L-methionine-dependent methyltransferase [Coniochaeta sp. 2T2.1]|nr:S-adenosyl-L-methionine-dependent methyltransferase [Coniochaeta sp. 2T2.1]
MPAQEDNWSSEVCFYQHPPDDLYSHTRQAYQHSASFVPKLATKIVQWLDPQDGDAILDVGCGDGVLTLEIARSATLKSIVGIDSSPSMIEAAERAAGDGHRPAQFIVRDANALASGELLTPSSFDKAFSNAALHWILRPQESRSNLFRSVRDMLKPGGTFAFEMGGLGNVSELRCALLMAVARRVGLEKAQEADPWFFPDEEWVTDVMEQEVGGWKIEKVEREWRPTTADQGGCGGVD